jgi:hypothetical protein
VPKRSWTDEQLRIAVAISQAYSETIVRLGIVPRGANYRSVKRRIADLGLSTDHFNRHLWRSGKDQSPRRSLAAILIEKRLTGSSAELRLRLIRAGLKKPACELCGWAERSADGRLPLELDHINGNRDDNRLENLRVLCPNCHSMQPTYRGLNRRPGRGS